MFYTLLARRHPSQPAPTPLQASKPADEPGEKISQSGTSASLEDSPDAAAVRQRDLLAIDGRGEQRELRPVFARHLQHSAGPSY